MADIDSQRAHHFPEDSFPRSVPRQQNNHASHNAGMLPAASNVQPESQREYVPPVFGNGAAQSGLPNSHHINMSNYRVADYPPLPDDPAFPHMQEGQGHDIFGYAPQGVVPGPIQAAFPVSSTHRPAPGQPAAENLRRLASRYVHHPDSQVEMVRMEAGTAARYKVVIVLEITDIL